MCANNINEIISSTTTDEVQDATSAQDWAPILREDPDFLLQILQQSTTTSAREIVGLKAHAEGLSCDLSEVQNKADTLTGLLEATTSRFNYARTALDRSKEEMDSLRRKVETRTCSNVSCRKYQPVIEQPPATRLPLFVAPRAY